MSLKRNSPAANLLRSSRLFSLPPEIRVPSDNIKDISGMSSASDTATTYRPIRQSITTPPASLARGDWGLKRPLPPRSTTNTTTPILRVSALDTIEGVTNFASAADHALTVKKWQELNLPFTLPSQDISRGPGRESAFDETVDNTTSVAPRAEEVFDRINARGKERLEATSSQNSSLAEQPRIRWKFDGPWIGGMSRSEFEGWLEKVIRRRGNTFSEHLRQLACNQIIRARRLDAMHDGKNMDATSTEVSAAEIDRKIKELRSDITKDSELSRLIRGYLDLPGFETERKRHSEAIDGDKRDAPKTHPSAGLSYLRSRSFLDNHPLLGPQVHHTPVSARIVKYRVHGNGRLGKLGVAGVVVEDDGRMTENDEKPGRAHGEGRIWVRPESASVDSNGRIHLKVRKADSNAVDIRLGVLGEAPSAQPTTTRSRPIRFDTQLDASQSSNVKIPDTPAAAETQRASRITSRARKGQEDLESLLRASQQRNARTY